MGKIKNFEKTRLLKVDWEPIINTKQSFHERALDMRWQIANEARSVELAITSLTSNKREWNNRFIKIVIQF